MSNVHVLTRNGWYESRCEHCQQVFQYDGLHNYQHYCHVCLARPTWEETYLEVAFVVSKMSHDLQTKHGCVLVKDKNIIGTGCNGFPRGFPDQILPRMRPGKYPWMLHSERNAIYNATEKPVGAIAYVTGEPCNDCLVHMRESGIIEVIYAQRHGTYDQDDASRNFREAYLRYADLKLRPVTPKPEWLAMSTAGA